MKRISSKLLVVSIQGARQRHEGGLPAPTPDGARPVGKAGFTLLELVVVVSIIVVLGLAVVLVLKPAQMLGRARDATRISDLAALTDALELAQADAPLTEFGGFDLDGSGADTCSGEASQTVYVSVVGIDTNGTCAASPPNDLPAGWTYRCAPNDGPQDVDGTGWIPVDFTAGSSPPPLSGLPADPVNNFASGFYYTYVCSRSEGYELTGRMASDERRTGGKGDVQSDDGGDDIFVYEAGSDLNLNPVSPIGYWPLDGGTSGSIANGATAGLEDASGNGNDGTAEDSDGTLTWTTGVSGGAISCDGVNDAVYINPQPYLEDATDDGNSHTYSVWYKPSGSPPGNDGFPFFRVGYHSGVRQMAVDDTARAIFWYFDNSAVGINSGQTLQNGTWYHFVQTMDEVNNEAKLFVDGTQAGSTVAITKNLREYASAQYRICGVTTYRVLGVVDEPMMFDRVLTAQEVAYQYEALKP